jgi:hypothetical protein
MATSLDYARPDNVVRRRRPLVGFLAAMAVLLVIGQFAWVFPWALFQRGVFEDNTLKRPLQDFFIEIGLTLPSIAFVLVSGLRCWIEYRETRSVRGRMGYIVISVLGLAFIGLIAASWVVDDVVTANVTH